MPKGQFVCVDRGFPAGARHHDAAELWSGRRGDSHASLERSSATEVVDRLPGTVLNVIFTKSPLIISSQASGRLARYWRSPVAGVGELTTHLVTQWIC